VCLQNRQQSEVRLPLAISRPRVEQHSAGAEPFGSGVAVHDCAVVGMLVTTVAEQDRSTPAEGHGGSSGSGGGSCGHVLLMLLVLLPMNDEDDDGGGDDDDG
jgi:hypothetical protein